MNEESNDDNPELPYVSEADEDLVPPKPKLELTYQDSSDDITLAIMATGKAGPTPAMMARQKIQDELSASLVQVATMAGEVVKDAGVMLLPRGITHCLIQRDLIVVLQDALRRYRNANEDYINSTEWADPVPSSKEL